MKINVNLLSLPPDNATETAASDLEGTLSSGITWQGMRDYLIEQGQEQPYKRFYLRQMPLYGLYKLGVIKRGVMKKKWITGLLRLYAGYTAAEMARMGEWVVEKNLWPGRRQLVVDELLAHRDKGRRVIVNTGQFEPILSELLLKMDGLEGLGTPLAYDDGRFTGQIAAPLNVAERKAEQLAPFLRDGRIFAAYGDTTQDLPMLLLSRSPVAVYPEEELRLEAQRRGWRILEGSGS